MEQISIEPFLTEAGIPSTKLANQVPRVRRLICCSDALPNPIWTIGMRPKDLWISHARLDQLSFGW